VPSCGRRRNLVAGRPDKPDRPAVRGLRQEALPPEPPADPPCTPIAQSVILRATAGLMRLACGAGGATARNDAANATPANKNNATHGIANGTCWPPNVAELVTTE